MLILSLFLVQYIYFAVEIVATPPLIPPYLGEDVCFEDMKPKHESHTDKELICPQNLYYHEVQLQEEDDDKKDQNHPPGYHQVQLQQVV